METARPTLNNTGIFLLLKNGIVISMALILKNTSNKSSSCDTGMSMFNAFTIVDVTVVKAKSITTRKTGGLDLPS